MQAAGRVGGAALRAGRALFGGATAPSACAGVPSGCATVPRAAGAWRRLSTRQQEPASPQEAAEGATEAKEAPAEERLAAMKESYLLSLADMENLRHRTKKDVENASNFAIQRFARDVIGVADVLALAMKGLAAAQEAPGALDPAKVVADLHEGLSLTVAELRRAFTKHGLVEIDPLHQRFDANLHNALYEVHRPDVEAGTVVDVQKKGYLLNHRVIRPADVGVSKRDA